MAAGRYGEGFQKSRAMSMKESATIEGAQILEMVKSQMCLQS